MSRSTGSSNDKNKSDRTQNSNLSSAEFSIGNEKFRKSSLSILDDFPRTELNLISRVQSADSTSDDDSDLEENQKVETEIFFVQTDFVDPENQYPSLKRGERLEIYEKHESGWWLGRQLDDNSEHFNWFPSSFLGKVNFIFETLETLFSSRKCQFSENAPISSA